MCALLFTVLTVLVAQAHAPLAFDRPVAVWVQTTFGSLLGPVNAAADQMGGRNSSLMGVGIVVGTLLLYRRAFPLVLFSLAYSAVYSGVNRLLHRPRPSGLPRIDPSPGAYSYPSGHSAFFVWLAVLALLLLLRHLPRWWFRSASLILLVLVALGCTSRIDTGLHWPSDVLGGLLIGIGWMALTLSLGRLTAPVLGDIPGHRFLMHGTRDRVVDQS